MSYISGDDDILNPPQQRLDDFWDNLITKRPGKVTNIFPPSLYANLLPNPRQKDAPQGRNAAESYQAAADECKARVKRIVRECHRTNEKYTDPDFDIEGDHRIGNCLEGLMKWYRTDEPRIPSEPKPGSIHRIDWIFEKPAFTVDGFSSTDVQQGANGDCWFLAAVATICSNKSLMEKVCVARDEECGVYGFVFYRDGEWISTVVDDNLYLTEPDFDAQGDMFDPSGAKERKYRKNHQTGSDALHFASCADQNETWLPLLEKAYAKVHGDYEAIAGGSSGEGVEDLTGGVTTKLLTNRVLSKERLWKELLEVNKQFLFSASSPGTYGDDNTSRKGLALSHAYSVIRAVEAEDEDGNMHRLVLIRNPWGKRSQSGVGEWNGAWSDGSKEWTPYWMNKLSHKFGDDGQFWMSYNDLLSRFDLLDRTRLFDEEWTIVQHWTSVSVAWVTGYLNTKFLVEIKKAGPAVFVLAQLDDRYFKGLEGKYRFDLHFLLQEEGAEPGEHIVRARGAWFGNRSISADVDLEPGKYEVLPKIVAWKDDDVPDVYDVVQRLADSNPQKLRQIGMNYDIANAKGVTRVNEEERKKKEEKRKELQQKKHKEKEEAEKEEAEKEKAEFEAWKKEKRAREEKEKAEKENEKEAKEKAEKEEKDKSDKDEVGNVKESTAADGKNADSKDEKSDSKGDGGTKKEPEPAESDVDGKKDESASKDTSTPEAAVDVKKTEEKSADAIDVKGANVPEHHHATKDPPDYISHSAPPPNEYSSVPEPDFADDPVPRFLADPVHTPDRVPSPPPPPPPAPVDNTQKPWNAVCVLGLRVYAKDPEVSIKLVEPRDAEEGAVLDADGANQAGATM
ncbi:cysteine proteinase [Westerdykella ornata]|uniref:Cysteine proteinase n=1 Tax=Westerdykella ornata TaxID=318751 RepID=A0A6A6JSK1_WESOR|nr:cysteine proteinase [Westerdykella ornata]KAF2279234.1 cysteine proteinase [Westerdykella ornata]